MDATQQQSTSSTGPTPDQSAAALKTKLAASDSAAASAAQNLTLVQQARLTQLTRTAAALKAKYGATDPRTVSAEAAVTNGTAAVARISAASQQAATPAPTVAATGWALHGRVYDANLKPVEKLTVFLVDDTKAYQEKYSFSYTNATGYFLFSYAPPAGQAAAAASLYIEIANDKAEPIYLSTAAFQPTAGAASYQNISLAAGEKPLGDPPAEIRKIALPSQKGG